ncbi:MAG: MvdC/MvdD family ATP grasp protein [Candidatus Berkiella sp.]
MPKVLIITDRQDAHARAVSDCLRKKGANPIRWFPEEFLFNQRSTQRINSNSYHSALYDDQQFIDLLEIDTVWYRRAGLARLLKKIDPFDYEFVENENRQFMKSLWLTLGESAKWVNPYESFDKSNSKIFQLREANRIGFSIPDTLVTNDRNCIINFFEENQKSEIIYKTFFPANWQEDSGSFNLYTTRISSEMVADDESMALAPGIFQIAIQKQYEVRATFFGKQCVAVQIHNSEEIDWRVLQKDTKIKLNHITLPSELEKKCIYLMEKLGVVFGCFDFIVTPDGEYVFLEINEMGQFLWIEQLLPELHLLDLFCEFLLSDTNVVKEDENIKQKTLMLDEIISSSSHDKLIEEDELIYEHFKKAVV